MEWQQAEVTFDGVRIHYYRRGHGRPVVAAHGFGDNGRCWTHVAEAFEADYDFIAFDARSHGLSDEASNPEPAVSDAVRLAEALGLTRPALLGHSMGAGSVAAAAAARPELFSCAILEDPGWRSPFQAAQPRPPRRDYGGLTAADLAAEARERNPGWHESEIAPWAESKLQLRAGAAVTPADPDAWKAIAARLSGLPVLLLTGENALGSIVAPETTAEAARLCPTLEVVHIAGAGHNIRRDAYERFMDAVSSFLRAHG